MIKHSHVMQEGYTRRKVLASDWNKAHVDESGTPVNPVLSSPPAGQYVVRNLYVNPSNGRLVIEYDDGR